MQRLICTVTGQKISVELLDFGTSTGLFSFSFKADKTGPATKASVLSNLYLKDQDDEIVAGAPQSETCWNYGNEKITLTRNLAGEPICKADCNYGFTTNGNLMNTCEPCDDSCSGCMNDGNVGDKFKCVKCSNTHPFRKEGTQVCLSECTDRLFKSGPFVCSECATQCKTCSQRKDNCESCYDPDFLFQGQCVTSCPAGFTSNGNIATGCKKCNSSCKTCADDGNIGDIDKCLECSDTHPFKKEGTTQCLQQCTDGLYNSAVGLCSTCSSPCKNCVDSATKCTSCDVAGTNPVLHDNTCVAQCPLGMALMRYADGSSACKTQCDPGFTTNGKLNKECEACDASCQQCRDDGRDGDKFRCT